MVLRKAVENVMWWRKWRPYQISFSLKKQQADWEEKGDFHALSAEEYYADTAYDSRKPENPMCDTWIKNKQYSAFGLFRLTPMPNNKYPELVPEDILGIQGDILLKEYRRLRDPKWKKHVTPDVDFSNEKTFSDFQHSKTLANSYILMGSRGGKFRFFSLFEKLSAIFWVFSFGGIGVWLLSVPVKLTLPNVPWFHMWVFLLVILATLPIGYIFYLIAKFFNSWSGECRCFYRRTGMWVIPRGQKKSLHIPFDECRPYIHHQSTATGVNTFLRYVHLPTGKKQLIAGMRRYKAFVNEVYIRHFMDISKPLPDVPDLEWCRCLDPITAEYDKSTNRPPRYWRDMPLDEMEKQFNKHRERVKRILAPEMAIDQQYLK